MRVAVLGAGVVGVSTAWFLARMGHQVVVLERACGAARETSFANGGQLSVSQSEPWAGPRAPWQVLRWLWRDDAPLLFRPRMDAAQWRWIAGFLRECLPGRSLENMRQMVALGLYSRDAMRQLRDETGIAYRRLSRGILSLHYDAGQLRHAERSAERLRRLGVDKRLLSPEQALALEPALATALPSLAGASWCPDDASGDVHLFTCGLAAAAAGLGVEFRYNTRINALETAGGEVSAVSVTGPDGAYQQVTADAYVLALGSHSPLLAAPLGLRLPVYPAKGYSATVPVKSLAAAPMVSVTDDAHKLVFSRLGDELRIAGTAELSGYSSSLDPARCQALIRRGRALFPDACDWEAARFWSGLRPATPGNVPLIGESRVGRLYLNTGHGTLGWTEGAGSGRALAEIISGGRPQLDFSFCGR
ncbi:amino acid dehydrogenase [Chromobacterium sp. ATCC 53434]|uniref:D-amino acid dehydrogenase n=1 Tax=Chromobacterium sp. (strain ATCC 53434 / SC 14030) TaxID=2059672 RepID=UPI000C75E8CC|nr:D-amino acid dehydrogenase [Chromobacterium sp. ATCC 53434]AUH49862.1 amino acid dehydrogenase [Chromobacterium sp. ATCC 53434]